MSSRSSSIGSDGPSTLGSISQRQGTEDVAELPAPRPTREEYNSYAALVHNIDKGDTLVAKRIIATHISHKDGLEVESQSFGSASSSKWPLRPLDLSQHHSADSFEESILAFASAHIREHDLILPRHEQFKDDELDTRVDDLDEILPNLLPDMMSKVDKLLNNLAIMRPAAVKKKRQSMKPMSWNTVLSAGLLGGGSISTKALLSANIRTRSMLQVEGEDVLGQRLKAFQSLVPAPETGHTREPQGGKSKSREAERPHQSQQEREARAAKRERKAARRLERAQAQAVSEATNSLTKAAKRRLRRRAKT